MITVTIELFACDVEASDLNAYSISAYTQRTAPLIFTNYLIIFWYCNDSAYYV